MKKHTRIDPRDLETKLATLEGQLEREQAKAKRAQALRTRFATPNPLFITQHLAFDQRLHNRY